METREYIWEVGQTVSVYPNGMNEKVKGKLLRVVENRGEGYTKFLYVEYTDPRDLCVYQEWFNDQTDKPARSGEWNRRLSGF